MKILRFWRTDNMSNLDIFYWISSINCFSSFSLFRGSCLSIISWSFRFFWLVFITYITLGWNYSFLSLRISIISIPRRWSIWIWRILYSISAICLIGNGILSWIIISKICIFFYCSSCRWGWATICICCCCNSTSICIISNNITCSGSSIYISTILSRG